MSWRAFSSKLKVSWRLHPLCRRQPKDVTSDLGRQVWPLHRRPFGKPELAAGGNCSGLDKLQLAWPEAALPWCAAGHGRSVFAAACLAVSRYLATAGLFDTVGNSAAWHTRAKGYSAQAVEPDVCRCAEIKKKHISSTTVSTSHFLEHLGGRRWRRSGRSSWFICAPQEPGRCEETGAALHCGEWAVVPGGAGRGVDKSCWLTEPNGLDVGLQLLQQMAPYERSYLLQSPNANCVRIRKSGAVLRGITCGSGVSSSRAGRSIRPGRSWCGRCPKGVERDYLGRWVKT